MISDDNRRVQRGQPVDSPAESAKTHGATQKLLRRDSPHGENDPRIDQLYLAHQEWLAVGHLLELGVSIIGRPAFKYIGDENVTARQAERQQHSVEELAGTTDERLSLTVLIRAWRLTDDHPARALVSDAKHGLSTRPM